MRAPYGSRFFHFDIQNFRNVAASGAGAPHEVSAPMGNPGSATGVVYFMVSEVTGNNTQDCSEHFNTTLDKRYGYFRIFDNFQQRLEYRRIWKI